jgi:hypothetical protein
VPGAVEAEFDDLTGEEVQKQIQNRANVITENEKQST